MKLTLTDEERRAFGLEPLDPRWERVELPNIAARPTDPATGTDVLFFDGDVLRRAVWLGDNGDFCEESYSLRTLDDRKFVAPITEKGKSKRLNGANIKRATPFGQYVQYWSGNLYVGNHTTRQMYFSSRLAGVSCATPGELAGSPKRPTRIWPTFKRSRKRNGGALSTRKTIFSASNTTDEISDTAGFC